MRSLPLAATVATLLAAASIPPANAQDLQVNQRLTAPTAQSDAYAGMTVGQLILALGLTLQGVPSSQLQGDSLARRMGTFETSAADSPRHRQVAKVPSAPPAATAAVPPPDALPAPPVAPAGDH